MATPTPLQLARAAYAAYGETTGGRNYQGLPMPAWDDLGPTIQRAWIAAALAAQPAPTQTRHPWRSTLRSAFAFMVGLATLLPYALADAQVDGTVVGGQVLTVAATISRVLGSPRVEAFLRRWVPWLAAEPTTSKGEWS